MFRLPTQLNIRCICCICCLLLVSFLNGMKAHAIANTYTISQAEILSSRNGGLPCDETAVVYQDRDGFMWIGARLGLYRYDGYSIKTYRNDLTHPHLYSSCDIKCIAEDRDRNIWTGTFTGANKINKRTGTVQHYRFNTQGKGDFIDFILCTKNGDVYISTNGKIFKYDRNVKRFLLYMNCQAQCMLEDSFGNIWIGTRDNRLLQYQPTHGKWKLYQQYTINHTIINHAITSIYEDNKHCIWAGTSGGTLLMCQHNKRFSEPTIVYQALEGHPITSITGSNDVLWIATNQGVTVYHRGTRQFSDAVYPGLPYILTRGVNHLCCDRDGKIWMSINNSGILGISTSPKRCFSYVLPFIKEQHNMVNCMVADGNRQGLWIGMSSKGLGYLDFNTGTTYIKNDMLTGIAPSYGVNTIIQRSDGKLILGTQQQGILICERDKVVRHYHKDNSNWLLDNCIYSLLDNQDGNILAGTWMGLCLLRKDGSGKLLKYIGHTDISQLHILSIMKAGKNDYWLSLILGIAHITGDINKPETMKIAIYTHEGMQPLPSPQDANKLVINSYHKSNYKLGGIYKMLKDSHGRIWACTSEPGLLLYNQTDNLFKCVSQQYGITGDNVHSIEEDNYGHLWVSTNYGISRLSISDHAEDTDVRLFTTADGLPENYFGNATSCHAANGNICFNSFYGITVFHPASFRDKTTDYPAMITDIKIRNKSLEELDSGRQRDLSNEMPPYMRRIILQPSDNDLQMEFSTLCYVNPQSIRYAYMLKGFDPTWIYTEPGMHKAYYSNLPSGSYTFLLKATHTDGTWSNHITEMEVIVLPPLWSRWWAWIIYAALICGIAYFAILSIRDKARQRQEIKLAHLENAKIEELNHNKLQFYTNITHEFMTPLTIISAIIDDMRRQLPASKPTLNIIQTNINRVMRLLQQILEFRKSETGHLHLRVSNRDLPDFIRKEVESIRPLLKSKGIHIQVEDSPKSFMGYFDADVLDKILYNLLSNAAKYSREDEEVVISFLINETHDEATITVADNGYGISNDKQKELFKRFYEGEHRKFNTFGTGIGLSLTKDLVELHHGHISVASEENKGTTFTIQIPINKLNFTEDEWDENMPIIIDAPISDEELTNISTQEIKESSISPNESSTILFVEDNEELRTVVARLLRRDNKVVTASNGKEALQLLEKNHNDFDIIISDIMMPEMDGIELTKRIKGNIETSHIPVLLLTAKTADEDQAEAYHVGADAYMTKPFKLSLLDARIHNLLKKHQQSVNDFKKKFIVEMPDVEVTDLDKDFLKRCTDSIRKHLADSEYDQKVLMSEVGASHSTLYRKLKYLTGLDSTAFIRNIRFKAACTLIESNPNIRISDLAYAVGYSNPKYFSTCFKNDMGLTPSEYIERHLSKKKSFS